MSLLEDAWKQRETVVYKALFRDVGSDIYTLDFDLFRQHFGQESCDPRWLHYGVFESQPSEERATWLYVSSGLSNPWESEVPEDYSGLGVELVLETRQRAGWAIEVLRSLVAFDILLACGRMGDAPLLDYGDRIQAGVSPSDGDGPGLAAMMLVEPDHYSSSFSLISGQVDLLHVIGITADELAFAKENGSHRLEEILRREGVYPATDPNRSSAFLTS